jgi:hypothetical protein
VDATPAERFRAVLDLYEFAIQQMRMNLRRRHPDANEAEIERRLAQWAISRPGAEHGDAVGTPRPIADTEA